MFQVKLCGITRTEDACAAVDAGADAIGLNFYAKSSRYIDPQHAADMVDELNSRPDLVGVFVNLPIDKILQIANQAKLTTIQLHGDESPDLLAKVPNSYKVVCARRMDDRGLAPIAEYIQNSDAAGRMPDAVLVDAYSPGQYGGTGETVSWTGLADYRKWLGDVPLILAGGLTPENVSEAIRTVRPYGVDVASGVEISPGVKCPQKMRLFVDNAKSAFESIT